MGTTRREFLKTAATAAASSSLIGCGAKPEKETLDSSLKWSKAPCRFCGTGCGTLVGVRQGKIRAVTGDPDCPVNSGMLCAKGYSLPSVLYGEDRLGVRHLDTPQRHGLNATGPRWQAGGEVSRPSEQRDPMWGASCCGVPL